VGGGLVPAEIDLAKFKDKAKLTDRYARQLQRLKAKGIAPASIEEAVEGTMVNLGAAKTASLVVYGEPQSGKTEMMICLTARLMDDGHPIIVHLMNDSVDLLSQNLKRFKASGLAPAAKSLSEVLQSSTPENPGGLVVFCKKNAKDLEKLVGWLKD
jgi:KaiC/GvpD/RAD55 family RecA-like ATPase